MGAHRPPGVSARLVALGALVVVLVPGGTGATASIEGAPTTFTGAAFFVSANLSEAATVILLEWDFESDGSFDANATNSLEAGHSYRAPGTYAIRLQITRQVAGNITTENATRSVNVLEGRPTVLIDVPDRAVATLPERFVAVATDPDPSPGGEPFTYRWMFDGTAVGGQGAQVTITAPAAGRHEVTVEATDAEGLTANRTTMVEFVAPGPFEGRSGVVNLALLLGALSLAAGLALVRVRRREARARVMGDAQSAVLASEEVAPPAWAASSAAPGKAPFAAASAEPGSGAPRIAVGGAPSALQRTRECPVCHNAVDADQPDCPICAANAEAERVEARIASDEFSQVDLSEVRALLGLARRERHLGRLDQHRARLREASLRAEALLAEQGDAVEWMNRTREAVAMAGRKGPGEELERAQSYLKLAESLFAAHQNGKAARHARRAIEILGQGVEAAPDSDRCHACGGPLAAAIAANLEACPHCGAALGRAPVDQAAAEPGEMERQVRGELQAIRAQVEGKRVEVDQETWKLLEAAGFFEKRAEWGQALEILRTLRERLEREEALSPPEEDPSGDDPRRPPAGP